MKKATKATRSKVKKVTSKSSSRTAKHTSRASKPSKPLAKKLTTSSPKPHINGSEKPSAVSIPAIAPAARCCAWGVCYRVGGTVRVLVDGKVSHYCGHGHAALAMLKRMDPTSALLYPLELTVKSVEGHGDKKSAYVASDWVWLDQWGRKKELAELDTKKLHAAVKRIKRSKMEWRPGWLPRLEAEIRNRAAKK